MDDKYKELLEIHRSKFSVVVDVERLFPILESSDALTRSDIEEINKQTTKQSKVDKVLDILIAKDNSAFKSLCCALESTYPHLLTVMFLGPGSSQRMISTDARPVSIASYSEEDVLNRSQSSADTRSQDLKSTYTRIIPSYEYDFQEPGVTDSSHGAAHHISGAKSKQSSRFKHGLNGESRHSDHNRDYDWLKSQCERAMSELQALKMQQTDNTKRYEAVMKESDSYRQSYMSTLGQLHKSREEADIIRSQNNDLIAQNKHMEQEVKNLRKLRDEDKQEMAELRQHNRDIVSNTGSNEVLNALDMYDRIKQEYDSLRETYADLVTQHSALVTKYENSQQENSQLKKQYEIVCNERDSAILERNGLKQQCTAAIRNWDQVLHERNDLSEKLIKITQQRDDFMKEMNQALASELRAKKELEIVQKDRDAALREYSLVMSERHQVHEEIEQLQEKVSTGSKRLDILLKEKKTDQDELETLKREITAALQDRDKSVKERNEISDKYNDLFSKQNAVEKEKDDYKKDYERSLHERDIARKERQEAMQDRDRILKEKYERELVQKEKADKMDQVNKETEHMKKQIEKLQQDLAEGLHEAEIAKSRRDWAMSERDKIVLERDSVRTLCDNLRRDRDRAVSDLIQALRDYDEMKKQKTDAVKELKELKEKYELMSNDKETRKSQLNSVEHNHSRDSAIDADLQEWESETIDIELVGVNKDDLGFEVVGGKDDPQFPNDNSIFVSHVTKGSLADGKLKVNDQVLRINNKDMSNVEKRHAVGLLRNRSGIVNMQVVRRRKISPSRSWQAVQFNIPPGKDIGIHVDNGLYISRINPGSYAAKEGSLTIGDRIVSINGRSVENMTPEDFMKVLYQYGNDTITLDIWRQTSPISSAGSSPIPNGPCISSVQEPLMYSPVKSDSKRRDSTSESGKGSMKNIKTSGSQTDSLDSPGLSRHSRKSGDHKDVDHKGRHSVFLDKALEIFRPRHKSEEEKSAPSLSRPRTMIETSSEDVVGEFAFPQHQRDSSGSSCRTSAPNIDLDPDVSGTGTWPKCVRITHSPNNGTVIQQPRGNRRSKLENILHPEFIPTARVPPLPPERNQSSSIVVIRHTPQNSDSTITYRSQPPSPQLSPQPSTASSSHFPKSPEPRRSFITSAKPPDHHSSSSSSHAQSHTSHTFNSNPSSHSHAQGHPTSHRVNNTRNPPRMPYISSQVSPGQYQLDRRPDHQVRPKRHTAPVHFPDQRSSYHLSPPSHSGPRGDLSHFGSRSNTTTPEPSSSSSSLSHHIPPVQLTDKLPGGKIYPTPSPQVSNISSSTMLTPVYTKQHIVEQAVTTVLPPFSPPLPPGPFPDSLSELDGLPPYSHADWPSSPSPSQNSSIDSRYTPTPIEQYSYPPFPNTSPLGRMDQDGHSKFDKKDRVWIPSLPSINTNDTSGSVEVVSDRSSPCSPFPDLNVSKPPTSPHVEPVPYRKMPQPGETRRITIEKMSKLVGFQIERGPSGGIFVSSVNENSLAAQAGLVIGDQLLEICAINMRNATYDHAARVLQQCGNNLTMLVQYNPEKYNDNSSGSSRSSSTNTSPLGSPASKGSSQRPLSSYGAPHRDTPKSPTRVHSHSSGGKYDAPRQVSFKKPNNTSLGIRVAGGNVTGIFVHNVEDNSPANGQRGIHCGDQILEFNGIDFTRATAEQAFKHLHEPCTSARFRVRYHPSLYNKVRSKKGGSDSFYIKAMFDHTAEKEGELSFRKDDLLHIEDTMFNGQQGIWYAWLVDDTGQKIKGGTIASKDRLEDGLVLHRSGSESFSLHDSEEFKTPTRRGSGSARRSFFRRSKKHQRNNSKDSRELSSFSDVSLNSDSLPVLDDLSLSTYLSVEKLEYKKTRPVVLIAPLADALIQKLSSESPDKYYYVEPVIMPSSQAVMEQGLKDGIYVDYWQQDDRYFCIRVKSISDICDKGVHCLLNVNPLAIERLQRLQIYPIVIYARHRSYKQLREVKDVQFLPEKLSQKSAKEVYDYCNKAEQDYKHLISATIQGGNLAEMTQQIKNVISSEQEKPVWVPAALLR